MHAGACCVAAPLLLRLDWNVYSTPKKQDGRRPNPRLAAFKKPQRQQQQQTTTPPGDDGSGGGSVKLPSKLRLKLARQADAAATPTSPTAPAAAHQHQQSPAAASAAAAPTQTTTTTVAPGATGAASAAGEAARKRLAEQLRLRREREEAAARAEEEQMKQKALKRTSSGNDGEAGDAAADGERARRLSSSSEAEGKDEGVEPQGEGGQQQPQCKRPRLLAFAAEIPNPSAPKRKPAASKAQAGKAAAAAAAAEKSEKPAPAAAEGPPPPPASAAAAAPNPPPPAAAAPPPAAAPHNPYAIDYSGFESPESDWVWRCLLGTVWLYSSVLVDYRNWCKCMRQGRLNAASKNTNQHGRWCKCMTMWACVCCASTTIVKRLRVARLTSAERTAACAAKCKEQRTHTRSWGGPAVDHNRRAAAPVLAHLRQNNTYPDAARPLRRSPVRRRSGAPDYRLHGAHLCQGGQQSFVYRSSFVLPELFGTFKLNERFWAQGWIHRSRGRSIGRARRWCVCTLTSPGQ